jgi:hypothetical protein
VPSPTKTFKDKEKTMTAWEIFYQGRYHARKNKKLWFLLWLVNALMAAIAALPVFALLSAELDHSLSAAPMMHRFNIDFVAELFFKYYDAQPYMVFSVMALAVVYTVVTLLTTGGTLAVFTSTERRFNAPLFFRGCGLYFWRFFRLLILALIFYGIFVVGFNNLLERLLTSLTRTWTQEKFVLLLAWMRLLTVAFLFLVVNMIFDYAKVRMAVEEKRSAVGSTVQSIKFVFKNFRKTFALFLFCVLMGLIIIAIYNPLEQWLPQNGKRGVILVFLLQELFILARIYVRLTFFSGEVLLYDEMMRQSLLPVAGSFVAEPTPGIPISGGIGPLPPHAGEGSGPAPVPSV